MANNDVFAVLADKTRRRILAALKDGERPVGDLVAELGVPQPTVSKHLKILREAGMVSMEAQGQRRLYAVRPEPLAEVTDWIHRVAGAAARTGVVPAAAGTPTTPHAETGTVPATAAVEPAAEPAPERPEPAARPARGAGARAAELVAGLSGLRRRLGHPRR